MRHLVSKGTSGKFKRDQRGWKGASTPPTVLCELGHPPKELRTVDCVSDSDGRPGPPVPHPQGLRLSPVRGAFAFGLPQLRRPHPCCRRLAASLSSSSAWPMLFAAKSNRVLMTL